MNKYSVGIDPGKDGGIVILDSNNELVNYYTIPKINKLIDTNKLTNIFNNIFSIYDCFVCIEQVHSIYGVSASANFSFGYNCGIIEGMIASNKVSYNYIQPKIWQAEMLKGIPTMFITSANKSLKKQKKDTKKMAELAVKRLYPNTDFYITDKGNVSKNMHDGLVDALLIAGYNLRKNF